MNEDELKNMRRFALQILDRVLENLDKKANTLSEEAFWAPDLRSRGYAVTEPDGRCAAERWRGVNDAIRAVTDEKFCLESLLKTSEETKS